MYYILPSSKFNRTRSWLFWRAPSVPSCPLHRDTSSALCCPPFSSITFQSFQQADICLRHGPGLLNEITYREEVRGLPSCYHDDTFSLKISKAKDRVVGLKRDMGLSSGDTKGGSGTALKSFCWSQKTATQKDRQWFEGSLSVLPTSSQTSTGAWTWSWRAAWQAPTQHSTGNAPVTTESSREDITGPRMCMLAWLQSRQTPCNLQLFSNWPAAVHLQEKLCLINVIWPHLGGNAHGATAEKAHLLILSHHPRFCVSHVRCTCLSSHGVREMCH